MEIKDNVALVTGAASGIGRALCLDLAHRGIKAVAMVDLTEAVGEDVMPDLIAGSIHEMRTILERIIGLGGGGDLDALRRAAHDMKSSSGGFGAVRLQTVARDLEWASRDNRPDDARKLVQIIGAIGDEAFETLEAHAANGTSETVKRAVNE